MGSTPHGRGGHRRLWSGAGETSTSHGGEPCSTEQTPAGCRTSRSGWESSGRTSELLDEATTAVLSAAWEGPDADRFRQEFLGSVTNGWRQLIDRLHLSEDEIRAHADEQDQASDARDRRSPGANGGGDADPAAQEDHHARDAADAPVTAKADRGDGTDPQPPDTDGAIDGPKLYSGTAWARGAGNQCGHARTSCLETSGFGLGRVELTGAHRRGPREPRPRQGHGARWPVYRAGRHIGQPAALPGQHR